jgi:hypothetical protein
LPERINESPEAEASDSLRNRAGEDDAPKGWTGMQYFPYGKRDPSDEYHQRDQRDSDLQEEKIRTF